MNKRQLLRVIAKAKEIGRRELDLSDRGITELPPEIGALTGLTALNLSGNQLSALPPEIGALTNLTSLRLRGNQLNALPPEIGALTNLTSLDLGDNQLSALPPEIGRLTNLTTLRLGGNQLNALPPEIGALANLTHLHLGDNRLSELPPEIGQLTRLTDLNAWGNRLSTLPPDIGRLAHLAVFDSSVNNLGALPPEIQNLTKLERLWIYRNPELGIPPEITGGAGNPGDPAAILTYYFENVATEAATRPLNEVKLLLLGQGGVGKTSLVRRLLGQGFDPQEPLTDRIDIRDWKRDVDGDAVQVNVWDFGGQEIMHATHQFFLTERSLYLVVLDARGGEAEGRIDYWLRLVESFGGDSPVIVVTNKIDHNPDRLNERGLKKKFPSIQGFAYTSAKTGEGIDELAAAIDAQIAEMEWVRAPLSVPWFLVKDELEDMRARRIPYIKYEVYQVHCHEAGITEVDSQETLITYLHALGVALNFREKHERFIDTFVLNPEWVTEGVYQIINARQVVEAGGVLHADQLGDILNPADYPPNMRGFILDVMEAFELCFDLRDGRYLVPDLLPRQEPELDPAQFGDALRFEYDYEVLPASVVSRFIVRALGAYGARELWRGGAVFVSGENRALVYASGADSDVGGTITLAVSGEPAARRDVLAALRTYLRDIHRSIPGLKPVAQVPVPGHPDLSWPYTDLLQYQQAKRAEVKAPGLPEFFDVKELLDGVTTDEEWRLIATGAVTVVGGDLVQGDKMQVRDIRDSTGVTVGHGGRTTVNRPAGESGGP